MSTLTSEFNNYVRTLERSHADMADILSVVIGMLPREQRDNVLGVVSAKVVSSMRELVAYYSDSHDIRLLNDLMERLGK
jgi:hypothetical protein